MQFKGRVGEPIVTLHAALRAAQRLMGFDALTAGAIRNQPKLLEKATDRCLRKYRRADQLIQPDHTDASYLIAGNTVLVMRGIFIVTITVEAVGEMERRKKMLLRPPLPGIELYEELTRRRAA